ncbi:helix-turn-helix domain-containing protein [Subtercola sp. YIM 133946]|uniref:helix-turn-helix domain-containing protein n=1 Tax=Subtercola sp. YIM 133946 TaxID=3118909 RepID=UPI002F944B39
MSINEPGLVESVAEEIRSVMARRKVNQAEVAEAIERSQSYVSRRLQGLGAFDIRDLEGLALLFETEPASLLGWAGLRTPKPPRPRLSVVGRGDDLSAIDEDELNDRFDKKAAGFDPSAKEIDPDTL